MQWAGFEGLKFARGGISAASVTVVCFGLTTDSMEVERAELMANFLNVAAKMHHIFRCIRKIGERLAHELETNRRTNKQRRKKAKETTLLPEKESIFAV